MCVWSGSGCPGGILRWFDSGVGRNTSFNHQPINMSTLTIELGNARKAYKEANADGKKLLRNLCGENIFSEKLTERIKTFEDVCMELGLDASDFEIKHGADEIGYRAARHVCESRLRLIAKVFNGDWKPDLGNTDQKKYYPWFNIIPNDKGEYPSGFGLSYGDYGCVLSFSHLGARPYFKDAETAKYVGQQFLKEYTTYANYLSLEATA